MIVPWGAGGGTDATARIIGTLLEKELGQPVNVVNRTGGSGVVGHSAIAPARARRLHDRPDHRRDRDDALAGADRARPARRTRRSRWSTPIPAGIQVRADAPYKTVKDLLAAIKANPGKLKASGTGQGGIWHSRIAGMLRDLEDRSGDACRGCRRNGAAPGLQDLVAGGVDIAPCSLPEARSLIDAGKVKSLAIMADKPSALYPERADAEGGDRQRLDDGRMARHRRAEGHARRTSRQARRRDRRRSSTSKEYNDFMAQRGFGVDLRAAGGLRQVHGEVRRRPGRDDEGGRHRQVNARVAAYASRPPRRLAHEAQRRRLRRAAARCSAPPCSCTCSAFPTIPGQHVGPALFPGLVAVGARRLRRCC